MAADSSLCEARDCQHRIEADLAMQEYDALEGDASTMAEALDKIARPRPNKAFDPWARDVAREALGYVSERTRATQSHEDFMAWASVQNG